MGYRFSRRIRICKGVHLNVSKLGVGISLGFRGASISTGPRGTYLNTSIPGTGISSRQRLDSAGNASKHSFIPGSKLLLQIDDEGNERLLLFYPDGRPFTDETLINKIKKMNEYKDILKQERKAKLDYFQKKHEDFVLVYKSTPRIISTGDVEQERDDTSKFQRLVYTPREFSAPKPDIGKHYDEAFEFARKTVKTYKFWKKNAIISEMTQEKMRELHEADMKEWNMQKAEFDKTEARIKTEKDAEYEQIYEHQISERKETYEKILHPDQEYLQNTVADVLSQIELPVDFSIDYAISGNTIELDMDLPEIEDFPQKYATILQSGKLSVKKKTISELNHDYATGVVGMAFFFAGILFNISPAIESISVAGYTQRTNKATGNTEDQYVYSVKFEREQFSSLNFANIDPLQAIENFEHTIDVSPKYELKTINICKSKNRVVQPEKQELQSEYYKIISKEKEEEMQVQTTTISLLEKTNSTTRHYVEDEQIFNNKNSLGWKIVKIFFLIWIAVFIGLFVWTCSKPGPHAGIYNIKSGKVMR